MREQLIDARFPGQQFPVGSVVTFLDRHRRTVFGPITELGRATKPSSAAASPADAVGATPGSGSSRPAPRPERRCSRSSSRSASLARSACGAARHRLENQRLHELPAALGEHPASALHRAVERQPDHANAKATALAPRPRDPSSREPRAAEQCSTGSGIRATLCYAIQVRAGRANAACGRHASSVGRRLRRSNQQAESAS